MKGETSIATNLKTHSWYIILALFFFIDFLSCKVSNKQHVRSTLSFDTIEVPVFQSHIKNNQLRLICKEMVSEVQNKHVDTFPLFCLIFFTEDDQRKIIYIKVTNAYSFYSDDIILNQIKYGENIDGFPVMFFHPEKYKSWVDPILEIEENKTFLSLLRLRMGEAIYINAAVWLEKNFMFNEDDSLELISEEFEIWDASNTYTE